MKGNGLMPEAVHSNRKGRSIAAFACGAILSTVAASVYVVLLNRQYSTNLELADAKVMCLTYWSIRSPISDATEEFERGNAGLLAEFIHDPYTGYAVRGLKEGVMNVRSDFPLRYHDYNGPDAGKITRRAGVGCDHYAYMLDYNVTMLRLQGRTKDIQYKLSSELRPVGGSVKDERQKSNFPSQNQSEH